MTKLIAGFLLALLLHAQTAQYPTAVATDSHLKIAVNRLTTTLTASMTANQTTMRVADASRIVANTLLSIDSEIVSVTSKSGTTLTVVRGFDSTTPTTHASGRTVSNYIAAWHHNALSGEVKAIEAALGANLTNILNSDAAITPALYNWAAQTPGGSLTAATPATVTLTPCPRGVAGANVGHYLYISGGSGSAEPVLITGGACTSGAATGTVTFTPANNHSGAWTIQSASSGFQEAVNVLGAGGVIIFPVGDLTVRAPVRLPNKSIILRGSGAPTFCDAAKGTVITNVGAGRLFSVAQSNGAITDVEISVRDLCVTGGSGVLQLYDLTTNVNLSIEDSAFRDMTGTVFELGVTDSTGDTYITRITRSFFYNIGTAALTHKNSELTFRDSFVYRYTTRGLELRGADAKIINSYFQSNNGANEDILIYPISANPLAGTYNITIDGNKFGNEEATAGETRVKIRVGTAALKASNPTYAAAGVLIANNQFICTVTDGVTDTACIALHSPMLYSTIQGNVFYNATWAIDDSGMTHSEAATANSYTANKHYGFIAPFRSGGIGFHKLNNDEWPQGTHKAENLLTYSEAFGDASWNATSITPTCSQADPFGGSGACSLSKTGLAGSVAASATSSAAGAYTFSVWLKSGTLDEASIEILNGAGNVIFARQNIGLDGSWRRYSVRAAGLSAATGYGVRIFAGQFSSSSTGTVLAFGAQFTAGEEPSPYVKTTGAAYSGSVGALAAEAIDLGNGVVFSTLGTPRNGTIRYCSDCAVASPCAGSGTGAIAKRLNGAWVCN